jgi:ankyrin repeat protein
MEYKQSITDRAKFRATGAFWSMNGVHGDPEATRLIRAIRSDDWKSVQKYLDEGDDANEHDGKRITPLIYAIGKNYESILKLLYSKGGSRFLHGQAVYIEGIKLLLRSGADVNFSTESKITPLMCAALTDQSSLIKLLLSEGVDINATARDGQTVMHYAICWRGHNIEAAKLLLENGANINAQRNDGVTVLMQSLGRGAGKTVLFLLESGADPNIVDSWGCTALHYAAEIAADTADMEFIELLLAHGADLKQCDFKNWDGLPDPQWYFYPKFARLLEI